MYWQSISHLFKGLTKLNTTKFEDTYWTVDAIILTLISSTAHLQDITLCLLLQSYFKLPKFIIKYDKYIVIPCNNISQGNRGVVSLTWMLLASLYDLVLTDLNEHAWFIFYWLEEGKVTKKKSYNYSKHYNHNVLNKILKYPKCKQYLVVDTITASLGNEPRYCTFSVLNSLDRLVKVGSIQVKSYTANFWL